MNIVQLCGGLGNQLFQYSFGRAQMSNGIEVRYDDVWYEKFGGDRPYRLDKFNINVKITPFIRQKDIYDRKFSLNLLKTDNRNFSGYWQYLAYYTDILPILKKELCVREEFYTKQYLRLRDQITVNPSVSIHVRRGDYLGLDPNLFPIQPLRYYFEALEHVKGDLFIFSDDIPWCKENLKKEYFSRPITFVNLVDYLDLELMRSCTHNIICASSFSWWAAMLNNNPNKVVVAPTQWVVNKRQYDNYNNKIHYPKDWIKL